jgi:transcriptional regulator with XRE-family HTH domain
MIAKRLAHALTRLGLSRTEAARRLGVSEPAVSRGARGGIDSRPHRSHHQHLARGCGRDARAAPMAPRTPWNASEATICARLGCGRPFPLPSRRRGDVRRFCSSRCRSLAWREAHPSRCDEAVVA